MAFEAHLQTGNKLWIKWKLNGAELPSCLPASRVAINEPHELYTMLLAVEYGNTDNIANKHPPNVRLVFRERCRQSSKKSRNFKNVNMTLITERFLICDGKNCTETYGADTRQFNAKHQRELSKNDGWTYKKGKDYCPNHKPFKLSFLRP